MRRREEMEENTCLYGKKDKQERRNREVDMKAGYETEQTIEKEETGDRRN